MYARVADGLDRKGLSFPLSWEEDNVLPWPPMLDMGWLRSLLSPLKKLWIRLHSARRNRRGIYILYEDVKSCPYEDVQILWSIVAESRPPAAAAAAASAAAFGLGEVGGAERGEGGTIRF